MALEPKQLVLQFIEDDINEKNINEQKDIVVKKIYKEIDQQIDELQAILQSRKNELDAIHRKMEATMMQEDEFLFFGKKEGTLDLFPKERCDFSSSNIKRIEAPILLEIEKLTKEILDLQKNKETLAKRELELFNSQKSLFDF